MTRRCCSVLHPPSLCCIYLSFIWEEEEEEIEEEEAPLAVHFQSTLQFVPQVHLNYYHHSNIFVIRKNCDVSKHASQFTSEKM